MKRLEILVAERIQLAERHLPLFTAIEEVVHGVEAQARRFCGPFTAIKNVRYGEFGHALVGAKGCNEHTHSLSGTPVVIVHGNQRHVLA
jgi:hypothetical protein